MSSHAWLWLCGILLSPAAEAQESTVAAVANSEAELSQRLAAHVAMLAAAIGARNAAGSLPALNQAAEYIESRWLEMGRAVESQAVLLGAAATRNLVTESRGQSRPDEIVVIGAHYDANPSTPGADDNASGVAALIELSRLVAPSLARTVRWVAFTNEESPFFRSAQMGSLCYAKALQARGDRVVAMLALEMLGFYADAEGSQRYPPGLSWFFPSVGNFVAVVGNLGSRRLVRAVATRFRQHSPFPVQSAALPGFLVGVGWSDHWSFWQAGYDAVMITDTAFFRNQNYHTADDTPATLNYPRMAKVVSGLAAVIEDLANQ